MSNKPEFESTLYNIKLTFKNGSFSYGRGGKINGGWRFEAVINDEKITIPFSRLRVEQEEYLVECLLTGIGWVLAKYPIEIKKSDPSREMQKTLHLWCNEAGKQLGASHDFFYCLFKVKYLMPQMLAAGNKQATEKKELLARIWESVTLDFRFQASGGFIRWSWASHEEVRKAMDEFKQWALTEAKITLTEPEKKQ